MLQISQKKKNNRRRIRLALTYKKCFPRSSTSRLRHISNQHIPPPPTHHLAPSATSCTRSGPAPKYKIFRSFRVSSTMRLALTLRKTLSWWPNISCASSSAKANSSAASLASKSLSLSIISIVESERGRWDGSGFLFAYQSATTLSEPKMWAGPNLLPNFKVRRPSHRSLEQHGNVYVIIWMCDLYGFIGKGVKKKTAHKKFLRRRHESPRPTLHCCFCLVCFPVLLLCNNTRPGLVLSSITIKNSVLRISTMTLLNSTGVTWGRKKFLNSSGIFDISCESINQSINQSDPNH